MYSGVLTHGSSQALAGDNDSELVGLVVGRLAPHKNSGRLRGYIAMLAVDTRMRGRGIGRTLVSRVLDTFRDAGAVEVVLEAEETNYSAIRLYEGLGFIRDKQLVRYYLSYSNAWRLKLLLGQPAVFGEEDTDDDSPLPDEARGPPAAQ